MAARPNPINEATEARAISRDELLTARQIAKETGVSDRSIRRLIESGELSSVAVGKRRRVPRRAWVAYLKAGRA
jgi:excisionase family DNA binding protein